MKCNAETVGLMHKYLDGDITTEEEQKLKYHLEDCEACQGHFRELKRTVTLIQSAERFEAPVNFTANVMKNLPTEKKRVKYSRWFKMHPMLTAAAIFFILMFTGVFFAWDQDNQLVVSKQENLIIEGDTVIVPEGEVVEGDLLVKNGNLIIHGTVDGNVTLVNGELIDDDPLDNSGLMASVGEINGEFESVDQAFDWIWYKLKDFAKKVFSFE
ncbi:anti-sigma-W factor RsiW [Oceanobacillus alkalisoli]|uniref:anti-sigma-W factor RsiW n=1 Tax=Oceanobacillus alkalisoli TaxID=2925113 RepID=UPI001EEA3683|nr:anti-sigma-W factor RsiW [Oceanobacillus alkalisoli]MCF3943831.1 anti-sigma-W factor RsiW [Oceanobacillus alkalisoli]MCG5103776.1 anti-sigma-W factor RsiW [Oceanobacillus alkalisoli]